ncbi:beta-ketoacyl synthase chain length factor [Thalassospira sp. SM2505]
MTLLCAHMPQWAFWENTDGQATLTVKRNGEDLIAHEQSDLAKLAQSIKPAWRRRLDLFGRAAAEVLAHTLAGTDNPRIVFCSRHGNIERTVKLLHQVATDEALSPADFSMSVHNAFIGVASINWSITASHTAISAGDDTLIAAMTETLAQLATDPRPVVLCFVDLPLPDIYQDHIEQSDTGMALAIRFDPHDKAGSGTDNLFGFANLAPEERNMLLPGKAFDQAKAMVELLSSRTERINIVGKTTAWTLSRHD